MEQIYLKAITAAIQAGAEILKVYYSDNFQIEVKGDNSPLTKADISAHNKIMEYLVKTDIPVLSEEGIDIPYIERKNWHKLWIVDPLDGTKEFIKRNNEFTVNIALIENNIPIFGVIYIPVTKELFFGTKEHGAYKILNINVDFKLPDNFVELISICLKLPVKKERPFTVVASRSHLSKETQDYIDDLKQQHSDLEFISKGSSLKLCAVAEGTADVYPRFASTMEWDTAAGQAIVEAMGGKVTKIDGTPLLYNREDLLNPWFIVS